jgi:hypothetical protein
MLPAYIFVKFTNRNIFVNIYVLHINKILEPIQFYTFGRFVQKKSKYNKEDYRNFSQFLVTYLLNIQFYEIVLIFKNFGIAFTARRKYNNYKVNQKRILIYKALIHANIKIIDFIDDSAIPFNGCKSKKIIRKKIKGLKQLSKDLPKKVTIYKK